MSESRDILLMVADTATEEALRPPEAIRARGTQRTRRRLAGVAGAAALVVGIGGLATVARQSQDPTPPPASEDGDALEGWQKQAEVEVPGVGMLTTGQGSVWAVDLGSQGRGSSGPGAVYELGSDDLHVRQEHVGTLGWSPVVAHDALWMVADGVDEPVVRLDVRTGAVTRTVGSEAARPRTLNVVATDDAVFVDNRGPGTLSRLDPATGEIEWERSIDTNHKLDGLATDGTSLFLSAGRDLLVVDPATAEVESTLTLEGRWWLMAVRNGILYAAPQADHLVAVDVSDPGDAKVVAEGQLYDRFDATIRDVEAAYGYLWVAVQDTESLVQVDPATLEPVGSFHLPMNRYSDPPVDLAAGENALWARVADKLVELRPE